MLTLFVLYLISENVARSHPIPPALSVDDTSAPVLLGSNAIQTRTLWDIIWACFTTTLACTWISVHPNVPAPGDSWWTGFWRRSKAMFWALVAPELVICWALRQWFGARRNRDKMNDFIKEYNIPIEKSFGKWSTMHGHFLQMGGFMLYHKNGDEDIAIATISSCEELCALVRQKFVDFPVITRKEIEDRSKGDAISKTFTTLQTTWFVVQCITRGARQLAITKLEIVTLALAALNAIMCFLWWCKPLDVGVPVRVYCLAPPPALPRSDRPDEIESFSAFRWMSNLLYTLLFDPVGDLLGVSDIEGMEKVLHEEDVNEDNFSTEKIDIDITPTVEVSDFELVVENLFRKKQLRVTDFHASEQLSDGHRVFVFFVGSLFGGIHCTGWNKAFPSQTEAVLWHASSIAIICIPMFAIPIATRRTTRKWLSRLSPDDSSTFTYFSVACIALYMGFMILCLFIYIGARVFLFVEAVVSLRALPLSAYTTIRWTQFLPHV